MSEVQILSQLCFLHFADYLPLRMKKGGGSNSAPFPNSCVPLVFQYLSGQLLVKDDRWFESSRHALSIKSYIARENQNCGAADEGNKSLTIRGKLTRIERKQR
jgi:hypothetical protein